MPLPRLLRQSAGLFRNVIAVWDADGYLVGGEGDYSFITEAPGDGYLYVRNGALHTWVRLPVSGAGVTISLNPPPNPLPGWLWFDPAGTQLYVWYDDGTSQQWVVAVNNGGAVGTGGVTISELAPAAPAVGDLWFDPVGTQLYVWYDDGTSRQWVVVVNNGGGAAGSRVTVSDVAPVNPVAGDLWFDPVGTQLYVWYDDGSSSQWVAASNGGGGGAGGGIVDAPLTGGPYVRLAGSWVEIALNGGTF